MSESYTEFFEKLGEVWAAVRETERAHVELPPTVAKELYNGTVCYMNADREFSKGNEEKASEELQKALKHIDRASADMLRFRILFYPKFAHFVIDNIKGNEEIASEHIPNYYENIENLSEIIAIAESKELLREATPGIKDIYRKKIGKLLEFSSHFKKTGEESLFSRLRTDFSVMPNNYAQLKHDFSEKFKKTEEAMEAAKEVDEKFPTYVAKRLCYGLFSYIKADKHLLVGNERGADMEMKGAVRDLNQALFDALKFRFLVCLREVRDICTKKIKGNKTIVSACESKYGKHFKNLHTIIKNIENRTFPREEPEKIHAYYKESIKNLQGFLDDFEKDEGKLVEAINGRQEARGKGFWRSLGEKVLVAAVIALVGAIVTAGVEYVKSTLGK